MQEAKPNKNILWVWRIRIALVCIIPATLSVWLYPNGGIIKDIINIGWMIFFVLTYFIYLPIKFNRLKYKISENIIHLDYGVIYFRAKTIPIANIQFVTLTHTPLDRIFKVATIRLTAPGGIMVIPGLREDAIVTLKQAIASLNS